MFFLPGSQLQNKALKAILKKHECHHQQFCLSALLYEFSIKPISFKTHYSLLRPSYCTTAAILTSIK